MVRCGTDVNHIVAAFESLVSRRMPEQPFGPLHYRDDLLARGRCIAADDMLDLMGSNEIVACGVIGGDPPAGVAQVRSEGEVELLALVDFVDRHQGALLHLAPHHGVGARSGKYEAERNGWLCHRRARYLPLVISSQVATICHLPNSMRACARIVRRQL